MENVVCIALIALLIVKWLILDTLLKLTKQLIRKSDQSESFIENIIYLVLVVITIYMFCYLVAGLTMKLVSIVNSQGIIWNG